MQFQLLNYQPKLLFFFLVPCKVLTRSARWSTRSRWAGWSLAMPRAKRRTPPRGSTCFGRLTTRFILIMEMQNPSLSAKQSYSLRFKAFNQLSPTRFFVRFFFLPIRSFWPAKKSLIYRLMTIYAESMIQFRPRRWNYQEIVSFNRDILEHIENPLLSYFEATESHCV